MDSAGTIELDNVFGALADPTRRDILRRVARSQLFVGQIAKDYNLTFAAVSKHLMVLEKARLIVKSKVGRRQFVRAHPGGLKAAEDYLENYRRMWENRFDRLDKLLKEEELRYERN
ncbi:MAG TPA: metalloregulator ArsR/SmtB family transcription factor [Candidatus Saccharimonadales bacterium]|nr:metalloregulator ArsR/SmtB family transcription factor [Candidatus Saccharimonadales bacterium]